jgi:putative endonuclease
MFYIYFAKSLKNGKVYVGSTSKSPELRVSEHNNGSNKWSSHNRPLQLIYYESYYCAQDAKLREKFYKSGFGKKIKGIIISSLGS